jgi:uncharacterized protein (TIGR02284 family)
MAMNEKTVEILNDLIQINYDRVRGYEKAAEETNSSDADLRALFTDFANDSRGFAAELSSLVKGLGGEPSSDSTQRGKIYRAWMDVKAVVTGSNRKAILGSCEYGEDAAQRAYERALEDSEELPADIRQEITSQKDKLRQGHDRVKAMRDSQEAHH